MKSIPIARDFMIQKFVFVPGEMSVFTAIDELVTKKVSGVPVLDEEGRLEGVLTAKDCIRVLSNSHLYNQTGGKVSDYMSTVKFALSPDMDIFSIASQFLSTNINTLPVVEGEKLVGIIARQDMLSAIQRMYKERGAGIMVDEARRLLMDNPKSIEELQTLAGSSKDQLASVLSRRYEAR